MSCWEVLGLEPQADSRTVKRRYAQLLKVHRPDTDPQGFQGAAGIFRLLPNGLAEHGLAVVEIGAGGLRVLDPPPPRFEAGVASR